MQSKLSMPAVLSQITAVYPPKLIATNAEYGVKVTQTKGGFFWNSHPDTYVFFYILNAFLNLEIEGGKVREDVLLG